MGLIKRIDVSTLLKEIDTEEMRLLGSAAIFLGVVSSDLAIEKEEAMWFVTRMVAAALVIERLGVVGLVEMEFGMILE